MQVPTGVNQKTGDLVTTWHAYYHKAELPKAVLVTLVWLGGRAHPVITLMTTLAILAAWRQPDD